MTAKLQIYCKSPLLFRFMLLHYIVAILSKEEINKQIDKEVKLFCEDTPQTEEQTPHTDRHHKQKDRQTDTTIRHRQKDRQFSAFKCPQPS